MNSLYESTRFVVILSLKQQPEALNNSWDMATRLVFNIEYKDKCAFIKNEQQAQQSKI